KWFDPAWKKNADDPEQRATETCFYRNYYPTLFDQEVPLVTRRSDRSPRLDLPFIDFSGIVFVDELGA
ncbi:MAG TPA: hypothetical protein PK095_24620, partial [Myxococcota bacterium]|nr:hypothetical protein [Myxococcota bacterium]